MKIPNSHLIGLQGEDLVAQHLQTQGCEIIARRWQCPWSDLDLVASDRAHLIFVEVKTRSRHNWDQNGLLA
ncbi:MAG: YraN family protein, partial [Pseudanabaenaceae cyanobacterium bins.68]|nr:YraN family protein [Pseudanabaenaceae cyanobacterium bins.68]